MLNKIFENIKNVLRAPKNLLFRQLAIPLKPQKVVLMLTDLCNSKCVHCNIWRQTPTKDILTPAGLEL